MNKQMHGSRPERKPTSKQAIKRMEAAESKLVLSQMLRQEELDNASLKFDMVVKIFECALNDAATIGEARRWFELWTDDVNKAKNKDEIASLIDKHGFEFTFDGLSKELFK